MSGAADTPKGWASPDPHSWGWGAGNNLACNTARSCFEMSSCTAVGSCKSQ
eukprot:CAMPEP_0180517020 /NCGR_PEP_ID=MMETSP1036_2-20121128/54280_1 /TAXON_ID=632150 /ORGANISM="Azadinium spinosum, Strain 3D9" /LENGTH=50 /DNA_ID=CAMNT_0022528961 /DNA_START=53 /DNA_END=202 /DNA_ORIENTATION=-